MPSVLGVFSPVDIYQTSFTPTIPAATQLCLLLVREPVGTSTLTATINGVAMTDPLNANGYNYGSVSTRVLRLVSPATGAQTVAWTFTAGNFNASVQLVCLDDVDVASPVRGTPDTYTVTDLNTGTTDVQRTMASADGDLVLALVGARGASNDLTALTPLSGETAHAVMGDGSNIQLATVSAPGAASVSIDLDPAATSGFASFGIITLSIRPAAGGGGGSAFINLRFKPRS